MRKVIFADNLDVLASLPDGLVDLIYVDPPFNTGRNQERRSIRTVRDEVGGDRVGFQGNRYRTVEVGSTAYADSFDDYLSFLEPRFREARRVLKSNGSFFLHVDYREVHYCKVLLDEVFGRESFINEIVWAYDYGARSKSRWPAKHDNILWYAKDPDDYTFNYEDVDRIPYMAPWVGRAGQGREEGRRRRTSGGIPSCRRMARRRRGTPRRSLWASWSGSCASTRIRETWCWTSSRGAGRRVRRRRSWGGILSWWTTTRRRFG